MSTLADDAENECETQPRNKTTIERTDTLESFTMSNDNMRPKNNLKRKTTDSSSDLFLNRNSVSSVLRDRQGVINKQILQASAAPIVLSSENMAAKQSLNAATESEGICVEFCEESDDPNAANIDDDVLFIPPSPPPPAPSSQLSHSQLKRLAGIRHVFKRCYEASFDPKNIPDSQILCEGSDSED